MRFLWRVNTGICGADLPLMGVLIVRVCRMFRGAVGPP